jgi:hypothetical protein
MVLCKRFSCHCLLYAIILRPGLTTVDIRVRPVSKMSSQILERGPNDDCIEFHALLESGSYM